MVHRPETAAVGRASPAALPGRSLRTPRGRCPPYVMSLPMVAALPVATSHALLRGMLSRSILPE